MACRIKSNIICSAGYTLSISNDGMVYSFGFSNSGGHGHENLVRVPKAIPFLKNIVSLDCGSRHSACLDRNGCVFTFGSNESGQLGLGNYYLIKLFKIYVLGEEELKHSHTPQLVKLPPIIQVLCGNSFTMCVSENGDLYSFGSNFYGQLGVGSYSDCPYPQKVTSLQNIDFVECGWNHVICKTVPGEFYCWGCNNEGQLGTGDWEQKNTPTKLGEIFGIEHQDIVDVKCGDFHTLILTSNQEVYSSGENFTFQLGRKGKRNCTSFGKIPNLEEIVRIECGRHFSLCLDNYNNLYIFGNNLYNELGLDNVENVKKPMKHPSLSNIIDISSGGNQTFVKTSNNQIYAFGNNRYSQLGFETDTTTQTTPIRVFQGNEDIWYSNINKPRAKSARK